MSFLHAQATKFIETSPFFNTMKALGEVIFTGSYALDTMTWPDIDVQLQLASAYTPVQAISQLSTAMIESPNTIRFKFLNFKNFPKDYWPRGLCITGNISDSALENLFPAQPYWKVDFWILDEKDIAQNRQFMTRLKKSMTPAHKECIMHYKESWTQQWGRPPQRASFFLYQAIVFEGLKSEEAILNHLRENGVKI